MLPLLLLPCHGVALAAHHDKHKEITVIEGKVSRAGIEQET